MSSEHAAGSADLLERVLATNTLFPVRESEKYNVHSGALRLLQEYQQLAQPPDELSYAVIRMLRYLKRHRAAMELMQHRRPRVAAKAREIDFYELELHYHGGERAEGDRLLAQFLASGRKMRPSWKRSIEKIHRRHALEDVWAELGVLENALAGLALDVDLGVHVQLLANILTEGNEALQVMLFVRDRLAALRALPSVGAHDPRAFAAFHRSRLIFACGFGWSGSGSVSAFLSQHKDVATPFGLSELGYLQGRSHREGILPFLQAGPMAAETMRKRLARFCVESVVCLRAIRHHYSVLMKCLRAPGGHGRTLGALVDTFNAEMLSADALADVQVRKRILGTFVQRMLSVQGGDRVLLNNVFMAPKVELVDFMDDARFVVVQRDARDQFVARRLESRDSGGQGLDEFEAMLTSARSNFLRIRDALDPATVGQRLRLIRFEDFIRDEAQRGQLLDWLQLPRDGIVPDTEKFDQTVSVRNAGIHAEQLPDHDRARIESHLGVYLP